MLFPNWREKVKMYRFLWLSEKLMEKASAQAQERQEREQRTDPSLWLSGAGSCARKLAYVRLNWLERQAGRPTLYQQEVLQPRAILMFHLGDLVEASMKHWIEESGVLFGQGGASVTIPIVVDGKTYELHGKLDGMIQEPGQEMVLSILEIKSISDAGFSRVESEGPDYGYACQATSYMKALSLPKARVLYENKNTSHLDEWMVEFSPELWAEIEERFKKVIRATPDSLPDREYAAEPEAEWIRGNKNLIGISAGPAGTELDSKGKTIKERKQNGYWRFTGKAVLPWNCSYCAFKGPCWGVSLQEKIEEGKKPIWYVNSEQKEVA